MNWIPGPAIATAIRIAVGAIVTYFLLWLMWPIGIAFVFAGADVRPILLMVAPLPFLIACIAKFRRVGFFLGSLLMVGVTAFAYRPLQDWAMQRAAAQYEAAAPSREILVPSRRPNEVVLLVNELDSPDECSSLCRRVLAGIDVPLTFGRRHSNAMLRLEKLPPDDCLTPGVGENLLIDGTTICVRKSKVETALPQGLYLKMYLEPAHRELLEGARIQLQGAEASEVGPDGEHQLTRWEYGWVRPYDLSVLPYGGFGRRPPDLHLGSYFSEIDFARTVLKQAFPGV